MITVIHWSDGTVNKFDGDATEFIEWKFQKNPDIKMLISYTMSRKKFCELEMA